MNEPTYETLRRAIAIITERWPDATGWNEVSELSSLLPTDPSLRETRLPEAARAPVRRLFERLPESPLMIPGLRPFGICDELASWMGPPPT
jgi:hypothetical protein